MIGVGFVVVGALAVLVGAAVAAAVLVRRNAERRNRVVPAVATSAPDAWAGAHTPLARLHRRLRAAVDAAQGIPDPDGSLIQARVEVEHAALAVDDHLVALHGLPERDRAGRMAQASAAVASVEEAAAQLVDAVGASRGAGALPAVEAALERARLVAEARAELDASPTAILDDATVDGTMPDVDGVETPSSDETPDEAPRREPGTA